jgi:DNA-binding Xre family transcriptional regulator
MIIEIFNKSVNRDGPFVEKLGTNCHVWTGIEKHFHGIYGKQSAHRALWEHHKGKIGDKLVVRHKCDNGMCVNIDHLELGTRQDNITDMNERGRARGGGARGDASTSAKIKKEDAIFIRENFDKMTKKELSERFGICITQIYRIKNGERWADTTEQPDRKQQFLAKASQGSFVEKLGSYCLEMATARMICRYNNISSSAHRIAWMIENGDIPKGQMVMHKCDNARCINHLHLELGTHKQNMKDRDERGRTAKGARHGMCKLTEDNIKKIKQYLRDGNKSGREIATEFQITSSQVSRIKVGKVWANINID